MADNPPPIIDYAPEDPPPVRERIVGPSWDVVESDGTRPVWFLAGLALGVVISWTVWDLFPAAGKNLGVLLWLVPMAKVAIAGVAAGLRRFPGAPAGLIASIPVGLLILMVNVCGT